MGGVPLFGMAQHGVQCDVTSTRLLYIYIVTTSLWQNPEKNPTGVVTFADISKSGPGVSDKVIFKLHIRYNKKKDQALNCQMI